MFLASLSKDGPVLSFSCLAPGSTGKLVVSRTLMDVELVAIYDVEADAHELVDRLSVDTAENAIVTDGRQRYQIAYRRL